MRKRKSFQILDNLRIDNPCHEDWDKMAGDERKRHCLRCAHSVTNLSAYTREEALKILSASAGGRLCVQFAHDASGRIKFKDRPSFLRRTLHVFSLVLAGSAALLGFAQSAAADDTRPESEQTDEIILKGEVDYEPAPAPEAPPPIMMGKIVAPRQD